MPVDMRGCIAALNVCFNMIKYASKPCVVWRMKEEEDADLYSGHRAYSSHNLLLGSET